MIRVLFTGVGRRVELVQAFRQAALVLNKSVVIYGADMTEAAPALAYCDCVRYIVAMNAPEYIDNLFKICEEDMIDLVIPTIDTDLLVLSENKERFEEIGTKVLISESDKIRICRDKNLTAQFFLDCGLNAPKTVNDWKKYDGKFPAFIKPKDGSSSINAYIINDEEELATYANRIEDYIVQPFIDGSEYTVDIFCDWDGTPISIVPRQRLQVRAGEVLKTKICMDKRIIEESEKLCKSFKPCGPLTVQLIRDDAGSDWFIEINPRYGGGAPLSMKAGARSAEFVLKRIDGETVEYVTGISDGAVYSRFDQSVCIEEGEGKIKGVIFDLDDTLYSEKDYVRSGYKAVSDYLGDDYSDELWTYFEAGKPAIDELLFKLNRLDEKEDVLNVYRNHRPSINLYPNVYDMLIGLRKKGYKLGIITDGRPKGQRNKLEALSLREIIDDIIITDELGGVQFRKPCDIAFRIILTRWKLYPDEVVYVGDNPKKDFQAAKQLGVKSIWLKNKEGIYNSDIDMRHISNVEELKDIIG